MSLADTQRRVAAALMTPLTTRGHMRRSLAAEAEALIRPNSRLSAPERLEIYARGYWWRLLDSIEEDFPGLVAILGKRAFRRVAQAYLHEHPSRSFTLRDLGREFAGYLARHDHGALTVDMARLEWAHVEAFDAAAVAPLEPAGLNPDLPIGLQPHITLLDARYPVDTIRVEGRLRKPIAPQRTLIAVHRAENTVYYRRLEEAEFRILAAFRDGATIAGAIGGVNDLAPEQLSHWFQTWSVLGWLTTEQQ